ncbi:MAG: hypothetical protein AAF409_12970 [Pseudomonadota bacterium]
MKTVAKTLTITAILAAVAIGAPAVSGETAVVDARTNLNVLWDRLAAESEQETRVTKAAASDFALTSHNASVEMKVDSHPWADNYAGGRVFEPAGHD